MTGLDPNVDIATNFRRFAEHEVAGQSPDYEVLAHAVAENDVVLTFLASLPPDKRQPNLLFAAACFILGTTPAPATLVDLVATRSTELSATMIDRRTQTNEAARCATLLPALACIPGPIALIEVGASAGLCLHPQHYSYDYGAFKIVGSDNDGPTLHCELRRPIAPFAMPHIAWAAGIDLNPLHPENPDDRRWLECLVWPGQTERKTRLIAALTVAQRHPVPVIRADLCDALPNLVKQAPSGATVVVFHSAVLAYVEPERRQDFREIIRELGVHWLSNEALGVTVDAAAPGTSAFVLSDGENVLAFTHPHGAWIDWVA